MLKKEKLIFFIIIILFFNVLGCDGYEKIRRSQRAYESFKQVAGKDIGINITFITDEWNSGVDAIGVVQRGGTYYDYYYRDTETFNWHHFYRSKDPASLLMDR